MQARAVFRPCLKEVLSLTYPVPHSCPVCRHSDLVVSQIDCPQCKSSLTGQFHLHRFNRLSAEQLQFIEIFITCEGKIKRVEDVMGISYQAVRSRLNETITALGGTVTQQEELAAPPSPPDQPIPPPPPPTPPAPDNTQKRREILAKVSAGELTAAEAAELLKQQQ